MSEATQRQALAGMAASSLALGGCATGAPQSLLSRTEGEISPSGLDWTHLGWRRGIENQRRADLGGGKFLSPILRAITRTRPSSARAASSCAASPHNVTRRPQRTSAAACRSASSTTRPIVTMYSRTPGKDWTRYSVRIEVFGYNHNTAWDFLSLRPAIYCAGQGEGRIRSVTYRAL